MISYPIAVTIDTNVFDAAKYDFSEGSPLTLLAKYVQRGKIKVVLSDIVLKEAKKHIAEQANKVCGITRKLRAEVLKESTAHLINHIGLNSILELVSDKKSLMTKSEELFEKYLAEIDAEVLSTDLIKLDAIIDDYFEVRPPFEAGEKKRKEFPDAFIACQIRERFGENEVVAIVSKDNGFRKACKATPNHIFFDSLGQLYNLINKEEEAYRETIGIIEELRRCINSGISEYIESNENIDVRGLSYDKDGIVSGFDYDEFSLYSISNTSFSVLSVDEMTDKKSIVTLLYKASISVDCYYEDYNDALWDSETQDFVFIDTVKMREEHDTRFACIIEVDREIKSFEIFPFMVVLGGDSRKERYEIDKESGIDYEQEVRDMDRQSMGLNPLGSYVSFLEEDLLVSEMSKKLVEQFDQLNALHRSFEDICVSYDSMLGSLNDIDEARGVIKKVYKSLRGVSGFPTIIDENDIKMVEIDEIRTWVDNKYEEASKIADEVALPDTLNYGETIVIKGIDGSEMSFEIEEIAIEPSEGSEEILGVYLSNAQGKLASGYIKLTVGYLGLDEDGGISSGMRDDIEYEYCEIVRELEVFIQEQTKILEEELAVVSIFESAIS